MTNGTGFFIIYILGAIFIAMNAWKSTRSLLRRSTWRPPLQLQMTLKTKSTVEEINPKLNLRLLKPTDLTSAVATPLKKKTGAFIQQWPMVHAADIHFRRAGRNAKAIKLDPKIKNLRNAYRKYCAQQMDALMKGLTIPITHILDLYKHEFKQLHPYEATVANLTITARIKAGNPDLYDVLNDLKILRTNTSRIAKEFASSANNASSAIEAKEIFANGTTALEQLYLTSPEAQSLANLAAIHQDLRRIPVIELAMPTVVLVGSPNVGKSSIVRKISTGTPEVNDYPFTTRGVTIGHILGPDGGRMYQVMDTPGLLDRPAEDRNEMEKLTFASLAHLPTAVIFVIDHTGLSGEQSSLQAQLNVRKLLKSRFPRRPWLDVISKGDLPISSTALQLIEEHIGTNQYLKVSTMEGLNVHELREKVSMMLQDLTAILAASSFAPTTAAAPAAVTAKK